MMIKLRWLVILTFFVFSVVFVSSLCEEGQIDINTASETELQDITQIGPARAKEMLTLRPFSSVDDMIRITGIGENNINSIKSQNLACVDDENTEEEKEEVVNNETAPVEEIAIKETTPKNIELQPIELNTKAIKSEGNSQLSDKKSNAFYGLFALVILLSLLFLIKGIKIRKKRNELA